MRLSCLDVVGVVLDLVLARAVVVAVGVFDGVVLVQCCTGGQLFSDVVVIVVAFGLAGFFVLVNLWVDLGRGDSRCCWTVFSFEGVQFLKYFEKTVLPCLSSRKKWRGAGGK